MEARKPSQIAFSTTPLARAVGLLLLVASLAGCSLMGSAPEAPEPVEIAPEGVGLQASESVTIAPNPMLDTLGLVAYAASMQGKPYRSAGDSPEEGFDCSGLVQHVFGRFDMPLPRDAASMAASLPPVSFDALEAADLLFFNTQGGPYSHVGIYLGDGRFVHAPSPRTGRVIISPVSNQYWRSRVTAARRPQPGALAALSPR